MYTLNTANSKREQTPTTYSDAQYLILASEPEDSMHSGRMGIGAYSHTVTRRRMLRRIRRELRAKS